MASRRKFSDEYKRGAVQLATQPGVTKSQIASELGINANLLGRWCKDYLTDGGAAFPGHGKPRDEEMASLKRELGFWARVLTSPPWDRMPCSGSATRPPMPILSTGLPTPRRQARSSRWTKDSLTWSSLMKHRSCRSSRQCQQSTVGIGLS